MDPVIYEETGGTRGKMDVIKWDVKQQSLCSNAVNCSLYSKQGNRIYRESSKVLQIERRQLEKINLLGNISLNELSPSLLCSLLYQNEI